LVPGTDHCESLISFLDKRHWRNLAGHLCVERGERSNDSTSSPPFTLETAMSAARLFRLADKVVMTAITAALIVAVPVSAVAFVTQTL